MQFIIFFTVDLHPGSIMMESDSNRGEEESMALKIEGISVPFLEQGARVSRPCPVKVSLVSLVNFR